MINKLGKAPLNLYDIKPRLVYDFPFQATITDTADIKNSYKNLRVLVNFMHESGKLDVEVISPQNKGNRGLINLSDLKDSNLAPVMFCTSALTVDSNEIIFP
jgi:hypothetical protein